MTGDFSYTLDDSLASTGDTTSPAAVAVRRLLEQYRCQPRINGLLNALIQEFDELDAVAEDLETDRYLGNAIGAQLDLLGRIVKQDRLGFSDADYEKLLQARILINKSAGRPEQIYAIFDLLGDGAHQMEITEDGSTFPAGFDFTFLQNTAINSALFQDILDESRAAGIESNFIFGLLNSFKMSDSATFQTSLQHGLANSDTSPTTGGRFVDLIT